jgi:hypothetical protein
MGEAEPFFPPFTPEQNERLTVIWDRLYQLYLEKANGDRPVAEIDAEIEAMIEERNAIALMGLGYRSQLARRPAARIQKAA